LNRQNFTGAPPTPEGILRRAQRTQHDTGLDPDSITGAQIPPQTVQTHAKAYIQHAALAGGQGRDIEMCEAFDDAALLDEAYAESERDHVLASYRPARQSVSEELAERILGNLHLPPLSQKEAAESTSAHAFNEQQISLESDKLFQEYLEHFHAGKIPPEAFPIGSAKRAYAEATYTGPPHTPANPTSEDGPGTPKLPNEAGPATA
jgi:hypothetical protein